MYPNLFRPMLVMIAATFVIVTAIVVPPALWLAFGPRTPVHTPPYTPPACGYVMFCPTPTTAPEVHR